MADRALPVASGPVAGAARTPRRSLLTTLRKYRLYYLLALPGLLYFLIFHYLPIYGVIIAFKNYKVALGPSGSACVTSWSS